MFDLKQAVSEWRESVRSGSADVDFEALEIRLLDSVHERVDAGARLEEAFALAVHQLEEEHGLGSERSQAARDSQEPSRGRRGFSPVRAAVLFAGVGMVIAFGIECFSAYTKASYRSSAMFELKPVSVGPRFEVFRDQSPLRRDEAALFDVETEIGVMLGSNNLYRVVDRLSLDREWDGTRFWAQQRVYADLEIRRLRDTRLCRISYENPEAGLAQEMVDAVMKCYVEGKQADFAKVLESELSYLRLKLKAQSDRVEEARLKMLDLAERYRISPGDDEALQNGVQEAYAALVKLRIDAASTVEAGQSMADPALSARHDLLRGVLEQARDALMDFRRKEAEYAEAEREYQLQLSMLTEMQEAHAKAGVVMSMPESPLQIHSGPSLPIRAEPVSLLAILGRAFLNLGWVIGIPLGLAIGLALRRRRMKKKRGRGGEEPMVIHTTPGGKQGSDDEISWA